MTLVAADLGNLFLAFSALAGLLILQGVITARDPWAPLNRRFILGLRVMAMLFAGRSFLILAGIDFFRFFILLGAALIPICVLLLVEGLLSRHTPLWIKTYISCGAVAFAVLSVWWSDSIDPPRLIGLLAFQTSGLLIAGWVVVMRDKSSLTAAENRTVERLAISLILLIPIAAADFLLAYLRLPAQISPLAVLFLCWLTVSLGRSQVQHRAFFTIVLGAALSGVVIARMSGLDRDATILTFAVILAALLVAVLFIEAQALRLTPAIFCLPTPTR